MHRKIRLSDFAGTWELAEKECEQIKEELENSWKKWTLDFSRKRLF